MGLQGLDATRSARLSSLPPVLHDRSSGPGSGGDSSHCCFLLLFVGLPSGWWWNASPAGHTKGTEKASGSKRNEKSDGIVRWLPGGFLSLVEGVLVEGLRSTIGGKTSSRGQYRPWVAKVMARTPRGDDDDAEEEEEEEDGRRTGIQGTREERRVVARNAHLVQRQSHTDHSVVVVVDVDIVRDVSSRRDEMPLAPALDRMGCDATEQTTMESHEMAEPVSKRENLRESKRSNFR